VDELLRSQLDGLALPVEICDETGHTLGRFLPERVYQQQQLALDGCPYTAEQLAGMQQESGGRSLAEIWKSVGQR
jgi:hypothetical protein